ncbi:MAG: hypothetical protein JOZ33_13830 [Acidobacteriaceae bacterium]|nr:hypothetical protein [Acidobacteriaceae bacterium]
MKTIYEHASLQKQRVATRIHRGNTATILRLAVLAFTVQGVVSLAQAQSTVNRDAATAVTTTGGTANHVTKFSGANTVVNSGITEVNGNVGIKTTTPGSPLTVAGTIQSTSGGFKFPDGSVQTTAAKGGSQGLVHDNTLTGAGVNGSPLGVANPLVIQGGNFAIEGIATGPDFTDAGVTGFGAVGGTGVFGNASIGVFASGRGFPSGTGVEGVSDDGNAGDTGVLGESVSPGLAGLFGGDVSVFGNLSKSGGSFKIDDPLAPEDKYLYHSFVESPDMMNIYNGIVTTDPRGTAVVTMPAYFSALNRDFRYQLTPIGQFAQAIVATELNDNQFAIQTDKPNVKVSWQVTGIRQDAWANAHRIPVEEDKDELERGHYIHPELYNHPKEDAVIYVRHPELLKKAGN